MATTARKVALPRTFYRLDSRRVSLREYWWGTRSPLILVALLLKVLRVRLPGSSDDPNVEALRPFEVDAAAMPPESAARMAPLAQALEALGFGSPIHHVVADDLQHTRHVLATFAHESGLAWARVHERTWSIHTPAKQVLFVEIVTGFEGGTFLWSLSSKADLAAPPSCTVIRRRDASPEELWAAHQDGLRAAKTPRVLPVAGAEALRDAVDAHHRVVRNFHLRRGIFTSLSASDRQSLAANQAQRAAAEQGGARFPEVMAEIRRLQDNKGTKAATGFLILLASLALFLGTSGFAGFGLTDAAGKFSLEALVILVGVVAFHEAGHFVAMKLFDYRNVKMFFIPFLGAAVSGRHYNVAGWKKAVVSLMGPVPGVIVGSVIGAAGLMTGNALLLRIAMTALILNGFNLLPILPLDGGWVVQALVASRHAVVEVGFRCLAVAVLLGLSIWSGDTILRVLAIVMAISVPVTYRTARATADLRRAGLEPHSADDQTIPAVTADAIVGRLVERGPKTPTKQLAQLALQVFEGLNSRPPGIAAALGIATVQAAALAGAVVFAALVAVGQQTNVGALLAGGVPKHALEATAVAVRRPLGAIGGAGVPHNTVIATFDDEEMARAAAAEAERDSRAAVASFGRTTLVAVPSTDDEARKRWLGRLQPRASDAFVATPDAPAYLSMLCLAPTAEAAAAIEKDAGDYLLASALHLAPPWAESDTRTPDERARHARARRTHARLVDTSMVFFKDARWTALVERAAKARRAGDSAESERLRGEMAGLREEIGRREADKLRGEAELDPAYIDRYLAVNARAMAAAAPLATASPASDPAAELGPLLGQVRMVDGVPDPAGSALGALGMITREGLLLRMPYLRFQSPFAGPVAFVGWLARQGCTDIKYEFAMGWSGDEEGETPD